MTADAASRPSAPAARSLAVVDGVPGAGLEERPDALLSVHGVKKTYGHIEQPFVGAGDPCSDICGCDVLDRRVCERGSVGEFPREALGLLLQLRRGQDAVDDAPTSELLSFVQAAAERDRARPAEAGAGRDALDAAGERHDPEARLGQPADRSLRGPDQVAE